MFDERSSVGTVTLISSFNQLQIHHDYFIHKLFLLPPSGPKKYSSPAAVGTHSCYMVSIMTVLKR